jgi:hypothetical protein
MTDAYLDTVSGDIVFTNGDISYTESTEQHQRDLIIARKGDYKSAPDYGAGAADFLKDESADDMKIEIRRQLVKDGQNVSELSYDETTGTLHIIATY